MIVSLLKVVENERFELSVPFGYTRVPGVHLKPLGHLSRRSPPSLEHRSPPRAGTAALPQLVVKELGGEQGIRTLGTCRHT